MKHIRVLALIMALVMICSISGGCRGTYEGNDATLKYLEKKYGEKFEYLQPYGDSMSGTKEFFATCETLPYPIHIEIENYREDSRIIRDNYIAVKYHQEALDLLDECFTYEFSSVRLYDDISRVISAPPVTSHLLPADASFEEYLADENTKLYCVGKIKESEFISTEQLESVAKIITEKGFKSYINIAVVTDDMFDTLNSEDAIDAGYVVSAGVTSFKPFLQGAYDIYIDYPALYSDEYIICSGQVGNVTYQIEDYFAIRSEGSKVSVQSPLSPNEPSTNSQPGSITQSAAFTVDSTGDVVLVLLDASTGYTLAVNDVTFAVAKDGVICTEGFFLPGSEFDKWYGLYRTMFKEQVGTDPVDEYTDSGYRYVSFDTGDKNNEAGYAYFDVIEIGNSAIFLGNNTSYESYDEIFYLLSFSLMEQGDGSTSEDIGNMPSIDEPSVTDKPASDAGLEIYENVFNTNTVTLMDGTAASGHVVIPDGVEEINFMAFSDNTNITAITLPTSIKQIDMYAFDGCTNLTNVYYAGSATEYAAVYIDDLGNDAFLNAKLTFAK